MKLNVGASIVKGKYREREWINIDIERQKGVNISGSAFELPFKDSSFEEIHCVHVLEHVTRDKSSPMLGEMYRVLKPGCYAYIEVPNFKGVTKNLMDAFDKNDTRQIHIWTTSVYGKNERKGMAHHWGFYPELLISKMGEVGFNSIEELRRKEEMISTHYKQEPVLLVRGAK